MYKSIKILLSMFAFCTLTFQRKNQAKVTICLVGKIFIGSERIARN